MAFSKEDLNIDPAEETGRIVQWMRQSVGRRLHKQGAVIGISGGIDSSVCLALAVRAFGPQRVLGVALPEHESNSESLHLARNLAKQYGARFIVEEITDALSGFGAYARRDEAVKSVFPEFGEGYRSKIVLPPVTEKDTFNVFYLTIIAPDGQEKTKRLPLKEYLQIVAASNFKQRTRMSMLYYHADRLNYAVIGTGNKNEHEQGFFVKFGDGGADLKPIAHLFKTQVYQLAEFLGIPEEIRKRTPTTDTYSAECTQEEFFFRVPFEIGDLVWLGMERQVPPEEIARAASISVQEVINIQNDIKRKIRTAEYLKMNPLHLD
ncbi:NH(3)-dependent NAD(+) synthetase [Caldithrix abyssi DSM 13497]|uniref:NH(3)-dependent NAD(+) synthetase n=1 Tax=Caldithrix abyssi DSM 13497 TaxID=880073 RepID=H1XUC4_CALAY|nr:NAD(+) synthase [Caldithrix abyssi]APF18772.1 nadE NAD+ synthase [Caldithrix abyssi DSM 13497]EHO42750.1 NH(3)-dependent NAD(+) synthetase [Caldithrix abyssi DSM 13497]